jgi:predicted TIM-barrel fold metal-dependent hydrolase
MAKLSDIPIIDIDTHFTEPADLWTSRAPTRFKDDVLYVRRDRDNADRWYIGEHVVGGVGPSVIDNTGAKHIGASMISTYENMSDTEGSAPERLRIMDKMGVQAAIVYPNVIGFTAARLVDLSVTEEIKLFHIRAYNDAIADLQKESGGRLYPQAAMPMWDIGACVKEVERCRKLGLTGVALPNKTANFRQLPYADMAWEPFFAACESLKMPINFHVGSGENDVATEFGREYWGKSDWIGAQSDTEGRPIKADSVWLSYMSSLFLLANAKVISNLVFSGILDRHPKLNFVSVESGCGWIPFALSSMEWAFEELMDPADRKRFKRRPTELFKDQIYASYWFEGAKAVDTYLNQLGPDNLMFETDFPHPQCLYPSIGDKVEETLANRPRETQTKILHDNAARLYGIAMAA